MHKVLIHNPFSWQALQGLMDGVSWGLRSFSSSPHFSCGGQVAQVILFLWFALFLGKEVIFQIIIYSDTASIISSYWFFFFLTPALAGWGFLGPPNRLTALKDQSWIYPLLLCHLKCNFKLTFTRFYKWWQIFFPLLCLHCYPQLCKMARRRSVWVCCAVDGRWWIYKGKGGQGKISHIFLRQIVEIHSFPALL